MTWYLGVIGICMVAIGVLLFWLFLLTSEKEFSSGQKVLIVFSLMAFSIGGMFVGTSNQSGYPEKDLPPEGNIFTTKFVETSNTNYAFFSIVPYGKENTSERIFYQVNYTKIENINAIKEGTLIANIYGTIKIVSFPS